MNTILITWTSWFIWFHLANRLLKQWYNIIWIDNENDYYNVNLKKDRREILSQNTNYHFYKTNLQDWIALEEIIKKHNPFVVINLAAQAWVRYSLENPWAYIQSNIVWFHNIIELSKKYWVKNFIYASSSSVYWKNSKIPFSITDKTDSPISLYAATKKWNELIAHTYSHLYDLNTIWLRFFTVYWPWSRPDMAMLKFTQKIDKWEKIDVYNFGKMKRDFTYIDDIVDWIIKCIDKEFKYEIFNIWNDDPVELEYMIEQIEINLWKKAIKNYMPLQDWDVISTWSDIEYTKEKLNRKPTTQLDKWTEVFIKWYKSYYK